MEKVIYIPDFGDATTATVVEVLVTPGDVVKLEQAVVVLEGDKATMDIPADVAGVVLEVCVKVGDVVSVKDKCLVINSQLDTEINSSFDTASTESVAVDSLDVESVEQIIDMLIPDLGDASSATVVELLVKPGDVVELEQAVVVLEGDKATMDIPAIAAGVVESVHVAVQDSVNSGQLLLKLLVVNQVDDNSQSVVQNESVSIDKVDVAVNNKVSSLSTIELHNTTTFGTVVYAGPSVRRLARRLGVDLAKVKPTGRKGRIIREDVEGFVKNVLVNGGGVLSSSDSLNLAPWPKINAQDYGPVEVEELIKLKQVSGSFLHRNWVKIPHVTQFEQADITDMDVWRKANKVAAEQLGCKLSPLILIIKVLVDVLREFPYFNASLSADGKSVIKKNYYHIGVAVDSPNGLLVPVIKDVDQKNIVELATEIAAVANQARTKGLAPKQMQGSSFTVSSLGGIGGTGFTPIVNAPDVAILGLSKASIQPVYQDQTWQPRLMLPMSLSYDHRVIDGADGARFMVSLANRLSQATEILDSYWPTRVQEES